MFLQLIYLCVVTTSVSSFRYTLSRALEKNINRTYYQDRLPVSTDESQNDKTKEPFKHVICKGLQCPEFSQEDVSPLSFTIQKRHYKRSKFITSLSKIDHCDYDTAVTNAYMELYNYRKGNNQQNLKFNMTTPVLTLVFINHTSVTCLEKYKIMFYLPLELQDNPPKPLSDKVNIEDFLGYSVYVHNFSDYIEKRLLKELNLFKALTQYLDLCVEYSDYITAVYDAPFRKENRRNEIWFRVKDNC